VEKKGGDTERGKTGSFLRISIPHIAVWGTTKRRREVVCAPPPERSSSSFSQKGFFGKPKRSEELPHPTFECVFLLGDGGSGIKERRRIFRISGSVIKTHQDDEDTAPCTTTTVIIIH